MNKTLQELTDELERLMQAAVDPDTGEVAPELEAQLDALGGEWEDKVLRCALFAKGLALEADTIQAMADAIIETAKERAKREAKRAESLLSQYDRLARYIERNMEDRACYEVKDARARVWFRKSSSVEVAADRDVMPDRYLLPVKPREVSKKALADAMRDAGISELRLADDDQTLLARRVDHKTLKID